MIPQKEKMRQKGFILIVVLCTVIMLSGILFGFNARARMALRTTDNFEKTQKALNCARAGFNAAIAAVITTDDISNNNTSMDFDCGEYEFDVAGGICSVTIVEESGKLNVNLLRDKNGSLNRTRIDQLLRLIDLLNRQNSGHEHISYSIVPSIIDWTDEDNEITYLPFIKHENSGAESGYYAKLSRPYLCLNGPLDTTEELLLVKGLTAESLNRLQDYVTVYGDGDGKININYASKLVIESLSPEIDTALAQMIVERRQLKPFGSITELLDIPGMTDRIYYAVKKTATADCTNRFYYVKSSGKVEHITSTISAMIEKNEQANNVEILVYKEH